MVSAYCLLKSRRTVKIVPCSKKLKSSEIFNKTALTSAYKRLQFMSHICKSLTNSLTEVQDLYSRILKLSRGVASLPDELIVLTLRFVTADNFDSEHFRRALRLSHVSRRFRRIVLADSSFWSTLCFCHKTRTENIKRSISRSGTSTDIHIIINFRPSISCSALQSFMDACSSTARRWRSLSMYGNWDKEDGPASISDKMLQLMKQYPLVLPRLHELHLKEYRNEFFDGVLEGQQFWETYATNFAGDDLWEAPNLNVVRCTQYIPPLSFPFTSFTSFMLRLQLLPDAAPIQVREMVAFLTSKPNISEFGLELVFTEADSVDDLDIPPAVCAGVTSFRLSSLYMNLTVASIAGSILTLLRMPKLKTLILSLKLWDIYDLADLATLVPGVLLPGPDHHPLLTSLTISLHYFEDDAVFSTWASKSLAIDIPLHKIPKVSSLYVTTFGRVSFSRQRRKGRRAAGASALREVQLISCVNMDVEGLRLAVQSLKDVGAWDTLERVVIRGCDLLDNDAALEAVGKERLRFMKDDF